MKVTTKLILKSVLDGALRGLTFFLLVNVYISIFVQVAPVILTFCAGILVVALHGLLFYALLRKEKNNLNILLFCIISGVVSVLCFVCFLITPLRFPLRELNVGNGLEFMFLAPIIIGLGAVSKYAIALPILKKIQNKQE